MKLAHKILLFAIAPILVGGLAITYKDSRTARQVLLQLKDSEIRNDLAHREAYISQFFENTVIDLRFLAHQPIMQTGNVKEILEHLRSQHPHFSPLVKNLSWNDVSGHVHGIEGEQLDVSQRYYWPHFLRGEFIISKALIHPITQHPSVVFIAPVFKNNAVAGGVGAVVSLQALLDHTLSYHTEQKGDLYLIDEAGLVMRRKPPQMPPEDMPAFHPPNVEKIDRIDGEQPLESMAPKVVDIAGVPTFVYYRSVPSTKWKLALAVRKDELMRPAEALQRGDLVFLLTGVPIAIALMIGLNNAFLRPIRKLRKAHDLVAKGDLNVALKFRRDDELGELAYAFTHMTQSLAAAEKKREETEKDLQLAQRQADAAAETKSHFIATMSHELRTPLQGILGASDLIDVLTESQDVRQYSGVIRSSSQNLSTMINNVLEISRLNAGKAIIFAERFRPSDILRELEQGYRKKAEKKNIILHVRPGDNAQVFMGDSAKLRQILEYLLDNAIKFTPRGEVTLSMIMSAQPTRKSQTVRFSIEDTGIGIEAEKLTQIFEPFFQTCERTDPGAGLGLTIAQKLAELIHGHISVTSTAGKGSVFTLEAPLTLVMDGEAVP